MQTSLLSEVKQFLWIFFFFFLLFLAFQYSRKIWIINNRFYLRPFDFSKSVNTILN